MAALHASVSQTLDAARNGLRLDCGLPLVRVYVEVGGAWASVCANGCECSR